MRYIFWGTVIGYAGGGTNFFLWYDIPVPPFGNLLASFYVAATAYAIIRHKLLDIDVIIRKTLIFAGLFSFVFGVFAFVTFVTQELLSSYFLVSRAVAWLTSIFFFILAYDHLRHFLIRLTDRFLFQKKFNYQKLLRDASTGIGQIKSLKHLLNLVVHFVTMRVRVRSAAVLVLDEKHNHFRLLNPRGLRRQLINVKEYAVEPKDPLIAYMAERRTSLEIEQVKEAVEMGEPRPKSKSKLKLKKREVQTAYDFKAIKERMEELEAGCCVPSFLGERLKNVLVLGEKKSGEFYTEQDLNVLYTLAQESAIAIENARLFDQAVERARELERINEALNRVQGDLVHALSETELANKRLRDTHVQLIHEQKMATLGRLAASVGHEVNNPLTILSMNVSRVILRYRKDPDLKVADVMEVFGKMEQNIARIKAVVNTLTGLLKKSEHGKFEPLSLKLVLEETLPLVQFQTYLENLSGTEVEFSIPSHLPLIKGDLERLQETFLNLFINAYHAMMGRPNRKISVTARANSNHPSMVTIEFSDNGCGMTDEVLKKIFNYGFTTKPPGKGSGMGLYMCRYIIELHGGEIKVRSHVGEGTTFVINLPAVLEGGGTRESSVS